MPIELLALALVAALLLGVVLTRLALSQARRRSVRQHVRDDGPQSHLAKEGTPSAGGVAILAALTLAALGTAALAADAVDWRRLGLVLGLGLVYGAIGLADDLAKLRGANTRGVKARYRIVAEILAALVFVALLGASRESAGGWGFGALAGGGWWALWVALGALVVVAAGNAVNLTDGVDGLAATLVALCAAALAGAVALAGVGAELALIAVATCGAAAGFLWFNAHPARIFMGDVGALGLGAVLGGLAVAGGLEWFFALAAIVFIAEAGSVILQVWWFKRSGRRLFRMAPLHHALELRGWSEPQVVARLALAGLLAAAVAVLLLAA